jgi:hypothetical protein
VLKGGILSHVLGIFDEGAAGVLVKVVARSGGHVLKRGVDWIRPVYVTETFVQFWIELGAYWTGTKEWRWRGRRWVIVYVSGINESGKSGGGEGGVVVDGRTVGLSGLQQEDEADDDAREQDKDKDDRFVAIRVLFVTV